MSELIFLAHDLSYALVASEVEAFPVFRVHASNELTDWYDLPSNGFNDFARTTHKVLGRTHVRFLDEQLRVTELHKLVLHKP
jgi:hypothetical protein